MWGKHTKKHLWIVVGNYKNRKGNLSFQYQCKRCERVTDAAGYHGWTKFRMPSCEGPPTVRELGIEFVRRICARGWDGSV